MSSIELRVLLCCCSSCAFSPLVVIYPLSSSYRALAGYGNKKKYNVHGRPREARDKRQREKKDKTNMPSRFSLFPFFSPAFSEHSSGADSKYSPASIINNRSNPSLHAKRPFPRRATTGQPTTELARWLAGWPVVLRFIPSCSGRTAIHNKDGDPSWRFLCFLSS